MYGLDHLIAFTLVFSPLPTDSLHPDEAFFAGVYTDLIRTICISEQLVDPGMMDNGLFTPRTYGSDIWELRRRAEDLRFTPRIEEMEWLPRTRLVQEWMEINRAYRTRLDDWLAGCYPYQREGLEHLIYECDQLYSYLSNLVVVTYKENGVCHRREYLNQVIRFIGREAWDKGALPYATPQEVLVP